MIFESKIDWWWYTQIAAGAVILFCVVYPLESSGEMSGSVAVLLVVIVCVIVPSWLTTTTTYRVTQELLIIRCGPSVWIVRLDQIHSVKRTRSLRTSPALSLDWLEIQYRCSQKVLVSPKDLRGFVKAIGWTGHLS